MDRKRFIPLLTFIVGILLIVLVICLMVNNKPKLTFELKGDEITNIELNDEYVDKGVIADLHGTDLSSYVETDLSGVDTSKYGEFEVKYTLKYKDYEEELIRYVRVNDSIAPKLELIGENPYIIEMDSIDEDYYYEDEGAIATDNIDEKINSKIQIIENVDPKREGAYTVDIYVADESGNSAHVTRNVYVVKDKNNIDYKALLKDNEITYMEYTDDGFYVKGYVKNDKFDNKIYLCKDKVCTDYKVKNTGGNNFEGYIDITNLKNGNYTITIDGKNAISYIPEQFRLWRGRIGDKMLTFKYDLKKNVSITISDFKYEYDIVIDPGHGGDDIGAFNDVTDEKTLNLVQSEYEKKRYEEHGLNVLLLRDDYSYGKVLGSDNIVDVSRKGLAVGYYGSVAKVSYSNHHNSNEIETLSGWEILVPAKATTKELSLVKDIASAWEKTYEVGEEHVRFYTRNFIDGEMFDKSDRQMYYFNDYYAVIRIPHDCFKTNNFIFEGSYLSNEEDFAYYYNDDNWKNFSEQKIKAVVEYLGKEYIKP